MQSLPALVRIGTRGSPLALWQAHTVGDLVRRAFPESQVDIVVISTKGDRDRVSPLPLVGGKGLFTDDIEALLRSGEIDIAVHSLKDMPTADSPGLRIAAVPARGPHRDVLISRHHCTLEQLPLGAFVGTCSTRRSAQIMELRPDAQLLDIRGNIDTRIAKALAIDSPYDAIVLAQAGVVRLGLEAHICQVFSEDELLPAPAQGALGIQTKIGTAVDARIELISDLTTMIAVTAERAVLHALALGCSAPLAVYVEPLGGGRFQMRGRAPAAQGTSLLTHAMTFVAADVAGGEAAGNELASHMRAAGISLMPAGNGA